MINEVLIFLMGTCWFSFLNVVAYRMIRGESFIKGFSYCNECHHRLYPVDLIPILSYILLKGRCRYCHSHISMRDSINELIGGLLFLFCVSLNIREELIYIIFFSLLDVVSLIDLDSYEIYDRFIIMIALLGLFDDGNMMDKVIGLFCISGFMLLMNLIVKDSFGGGDIKLMGVSGLFLGYRLIILSTMISFLIGGLYSLYLMIKYKDGHRYIAFAPWLSLGMILAVIITNLY